MVGFIETESGGDSLLIFAPLGDGYLIYWFPDPSQINFTGLGGR